jgi:glycerol-3-phosphate dehydrogenase (NAD(P)+)
VRIAVVGAGSWGTALAHTLAGEQRDHIALWARRPEIAAAIAATRHNPAYLSDIELHASIQVDADLRSVVDGAGIVIFAVPTGGMREVAGRARSSMSANAVVVSAAKGFEQQSGLTMTAVLGEVLGSASRDRVVALSGPNIAIEVARGLPAATVVAGADDAATFVRDQCTSPSLRFYSTTDCVGVEYAGALKNVVAIAAGACDGIHAGDNGKAAIITRGIAEMARLGISAGAHVMTFAGLAGLGDCVVTCMSPHSRNRQLGEAIAGGESLEDALRRINMVVEGVGATRVAVRMARDTGVDMPITQQVHAALFEGKPVVAALEALMSRDPAVEARGL